MTYTRWTTTQEDALWNAHREHPGWSTKKLATELDRPWKSVDNRLYLLKCAREEHWLDAARVGFLDLESTSLHADSGHLLSWGLLATDGTVYSDLITRREIMSAEVEPDKRIVASCLKALYNVDCVVTYNGTRFDMPLLRSRAMVHGLTYPAYGQLLHIDLYFAAKSSLRLTSKRMGNVSRFLGLTEKDSYDITVWNRARRGDTEALQHIYSHNVGDLHITQDLFIALGPYRKWLRRSA
mgnify:CR=1 FL=1